MKRRSFMVGVGAAGFASTGLPSLAAEAGEEVKLNEKDVILFQGDSITDAGREKKNPVANQGLGRGYPSVVAKTMLADHGELNLQIHNRGISGNKVPDLDRRWKADCLDLEPRILSILIGVNDIWHQLNGRYDGTAETYEKGYTDLLKRTREALPQTVIVVCEPFVLMSGTVKQNQAKWFPEFDKRRAIAKQVAEAAKAVWVPFQSMFDDAVSAGTAPEALARDGVHPSPAGHELMAKTWREIVGV
ncbi:MAG: SGNH/GDSL hydrolase family protein [Planctomycetota bacterium]|nr:SGNH/GDSL hydrolase family protein [Planctomycetota bacterium]